MTSAIQLSWLCLAYPCLLFAYIGQAAYISENEGAYSNPFFESVPPGMFYPSLVISILAAIVASQALIVRTSILSSLACWPLRVINKACADLEIDQCVPTSHTSHEHQLLPSDQDGVHKRQVPRSSLHPVCQLAHDDWNSHRHSCLQQRKHILSGQLCYDPEYSFERKQTTKLGHAYGFCVVLVTFITTCLVALVALIVWRVQWWLVLPVWFIFITLDGLFLSSAATKFIDGAWFTFALALILASFFILWRYGKEQQWASESKHRIQPGELMYKTPEGLTRLAEKFGGGDIYHFKGTPAPQSPTPALADTPT